MARIIFLIAVFILCALPTAQAQTTGRVCYSRTSTKIISVNRRCPKGYAELTGTVIRRLTITQGLKGATGAKGAKGDPGDKGATGDKGARGESAFDRIPSGKSVFGVVGGVLTGASQLSGDEARWSSVVSIVGALPNSLTDYEVIVKYNSVFSQCAVSAPNRNRFPCLNGADQSASALCTGSVDNPTAPAGKLCIYASSLNNGYDVQGVAARNARAGFEVQWKSVPSESAVSEFKAVWVYTAP